LADYSIKETLEEVSEHIGKEVASEIDKKESTFRYTTMPIASADNVGQVVQYIGETTQVEPIYTNGYFYKCVPKEVEGETVYEWESVEVQPSAGISQQDLATAEDVQEVKDTIDLMYGFDVLAHEEDVQAVKDIIDQINDFIPYYV